MAIVFGILFILAGVFGFVPAFLYGGELFGMFSAGPLHNSADLACGALALLSVWGGRDYPLLYFKILGMLFAIATIIGFVQGDTILGLQTVTAADNFLHLVIALVALWAGFGAKPQMLQRQGLAA